MMQRQRWVGWRTILRQGNRTNVFHVVRDGEPHRGGDMGCRTCWGSYPESCPCGGLVHVGLTTEHTRCDECGAGKGVGACEW